MGGKALTGVLPKGTQCHCLCGGTHSRTHMPTVKSCGTGIFKVLYSTLNICSRTGLLQPKDKMNTCSAARFGRGAGNFRIFRQFRIFLIVLNSLTIQNSFPIHNSLTILNCITVLNYLTINFFAW